MIEVFYSIFRFFAVCSKTFQNLNYASETSLIFSDMNESACLSLTVLILIENIGSNSTAHSWDATETGIVIFIAVHGVRCPILRIVRWNFMHTECVALYEELCLSGVSVLHCIARVKEKKWIARHDFMHTECVAPGFSEISALFSHCLIGMHEVIGRLGMDDWINGKEWCF